MQDYILRCNVGNTSKTIISQISKYVPGERISGIFLRLPQACQFLPPCYSASPILPFFNTIAIWIPHLWKSTCCWHWFDMIVQKIASCSTMSLQNRGWRTPDRVIEWVLQQAVNKEQYDDLAESKVAPKRRSVKVQKRYCWQGVLSDFFKVLTQATF